MNSQIQAVMRGRPSHERLQIALMAALVSQTHGEDGLQEIINSVLPSGADYNAVVAGKPLHYYLGKTQAQIKEQAGDDAPEVLKALEDRGMQVPDALHTQTAFNETEDRAARNVRLPSAPHPELSQGAAIGANAQVEPTFGDEQMPASELWGMDDAELAQQPGISQASIREIRRLQAAEQERHALATGAVGVGPAQPPPPNPSILGQPRDAQQRDSQRERDASGKFAKGTTQPSEYERSNEGGAQGDSQK